MRIGHSCIGTFRDRVSLMIVHLDSSLLLASTLSLSSWTGYACACCSDLELNQAEVVSAQSSSLEPLKSTPCCLAVSTRFVRAIS